MILITAGLPHYLSLATNNKKHVCETTRCIKTIKMVSWHFAQGDGKRFVNCSSPQLLLCCNAAVLTF